MADSTPLEIENSLDLLIALLAAPGESGKAGEPVNGITRLQKLLFLLERGEGPAAIVEAAKEFAFDAYKMGPFSKSLYKDLDVLTSLGMLTTSKLEYVIADDGDPEEFDLDDRPTRVVESTQYRLSDVGMKAGADLLAGMKRKDRDALTEFKKYFNSIPLRQLLIFVYRKYSDYTTKSEIRHQLGL